MKIQTDRMLSAADQATTLLKALANRRRSWAAPPYKARRGTLYKYIKNVKSASEGCVTDE